MAGKTKISLPFVGGSSLLTAFGVLCLSVLALLSLVTAQAEQRLSTAAAESVENWYRAETQAGEIFARLRSGEPVAQVREEGGVFRYACPISHNQDLAVTLRREEETWHILQWQALAKSQTEGEPLPLWNGGKLP